MLSEILEGINDYFEKDEDILVDCLIFLKNNLSNKVNKVYIYDVLDKLNRCRSCGTEKMFYEWKETHTELESNNIEYHSYDYCPNCKL